jgi:tetratricopeptide (TPR) repeat protein
MAEGQTETAKAQFTTALAEDPQCVQALGNLPVLSARLGNLEDAARMLKLAVETDPGYEKGFLNLGLVLGLAGHHGARAGTRTRSTGCCSSKCVTATRARSTGENQFAKPVTRGTEDTKKSAGKAITLESAARATTAA